MKSTAVVNRPKSQSRGRRILRQLVEYRYLHLMVIPGMLFFLLFKYVPMYGIMIAFKNYKGASGGFEAIMSSPWIGFKNFEIFFKSLYCQRVFKNTIYLSVLRLIFSFPAPILLALLINEIRTNWFKRTVQTITYMPHFISAMVICGLAVDFFKADGMLTTMLVRVFGVEKTNLLSVKSYFQPIYVAMQIWQDTGWDSIIFVAALAGIDPTLYEAAVMDGAGRFRRVWSVTLPSIMPTIVILLIMRIGNMMTLGWEKIVLLYNQMTYETSDVISTYVYRRGLIQFDYSFSAAVGFFNSIVNFLLLIGANALSRKVNETSLW